MQFRSLICGFLLATFANWSFANANSKDSSGPVDLLLCLAADVSESVTKAEYDLQKRGHAAAIADPQVVDIITSGRHGKIAALYVEWAKQDQQFLSVDWQVIEDETSARAFADKIETAPAPPWIGWKVRNTATTAIIQYCMQRFADAPVQSDKKIIDISSDGTNNVGTPITTYRDNAVRQGIIINALAIEDSISPFPDGTHTRPYGGLVKYFENNVVGGVGSFVQRASGYESFGKMIKRKFLLELASAR